ncbi:MAG: DUF2752 domain-containing protein [Frankiaceae bacterium]|nr:DUF2752 domain-containing protein [Frankiaceae bacterium]
MPRAVTLSGLRLAVMLGLAVVLANVHPRDRPATVCLLRGVTGVPCPFCGGTTAAIRVGSGDLLGALHASPLAVVGAPVVAALPLLRGRLARLSRSVRLGVLATAVLASELWQLLRFDWL